MGERSTDEHAWRTAKSCDGGQCMQIGTLGESVLVRSSVDPDGAYVTFSHDGWRLFVARLKGGDFDGL
jgi:hypothetical protein